MKTLFLLLFTLLYSYQCHAEYRLIREEYEPETNTWIEVSCIFGKLPAYGYAPIRVKVNNGTAQDRSFTLNFSSKDGYSYNSEVNRVESQFRVQCPAGGFSQYDLTVPVNTVISSGTYGDENKLEVTIITSGFPTKDGSMESSMPEEWPSVIMGNELFVVNASRLDDHLNKSYLGSSRHGSVEFAGEFDPKVMPEDHRAYKGYEVIIMTAAEWKLLSPGARLAILESNRLGSKLIIYTKQRSETLTSLQIASPQDGAKSALRSFGSVSIENLPADNKLPLKNTASIVGDRAKAKETFYLSIVDDYLSKWPLEKVLGNKNFNIAFFIIILLIFGILVGPINLFVFAKKGKRHRLFITTPLISLAASLLLIITIIIQDGFGGKGHRLLLMEVRADENKAYIIQEQVSRTGVLLKNSFETSESTLISPVVLAQSRWTRVTDSYKSSNSYTVNLGEKGLKAEGDWFQSRSVHGHLLQTLRPSRGKISLLNQSPSQAPTLTSSFDFDLDTVFYQDPDSVWWKSDTLPKAKPTAFKASSREEFNLWFKKHQARFVKNQSDKMKLLTLQADRFYTFTPHAKATETYSGIKWLSTDTFLTGNLDK